MDCMEVLYDLKELLTKELDKIVEKHDINPTELEMSYKAVDIIKDICTIDAMENAAEDEWGEEGSYEGGYSGRRGYSRAGGRSNRGSYEGGGYSGRRGYSRAGRSNRGSYEGGGSGNSYRMSYDDAEMSKEHMMQKIDEMQRQLQQM